MTSWTRYRFITNEDDPRPVKFPPPGPYWVTATLSPGPGSVVVAEFPDNAMPLDYWPELHDLEAQASDGPHFTDRFPKPRWYEPPPQPAASEAVLRAVLLEHAYLDPCSRQSVCACGWDLNPYLSSTAWSQWADHVLAARAAAGGKGNG